MGLIFIAITASVGVFALFFKQYHEKQSDWAREKRHFESYQHINQGKTFDLPRPEFNKTLPSIISAAVIGLLIGFESLVVIPAGHIGVQVTFGEVNQATLAEGLHLVNPLSRVKEVEVRLVTTQLKQASAGTKDLQQIHTDIVLNYRIDGSKAAHIYKEFGFDLQDRVILPALSESLKAVTAHYTSEELITKRDVVSGQVKEEVAGKLGKYGVMVGDISLVNFGFSAEYQKAIESKVIAMQSKLQAEQDLQRIEVEAKQAIAKAEGRAKAIQIETQAINSQGGASYVQLKAIEKWDGNLPSTMAGGAVPFINVK
jgi:regulator of protease activity HflC (stomatin/prohibitin superfamily)